MTGDLFGGGFVWDEAEPVSQTDATVVATRQGQGRALEKAGNPDLLDGGVASVASVAETEGQRPERLLSQPNVAVPATLPATPKAADFCGVEGGARPTVAGVATVADWERGVAAARAMRCPTGANAREWRATVAAAAHLLRLWGSDLIALGWSTLDVWGSELDPAARRLDRLGLVHFVAGAVVEAVDSDSALILHSGKDRLTYRRRRMVPGAVPLWAVGAGASRWEGAGEAPSALPRPPAPCQPASGEGV
ncbi:MAG: hypothetical protein PGN16_08475 [Sphingomonas phyllosphaerae]|uniref:hypothetical protein n=1 Tax=Sphingomonas phyllosphaerae TaxID=257003 RepID=UPI002FF81757